MMAEVVDADGLSARSIRNCSRLPKNSSGSRSSRRGSKHSLPELKNSQVVLTNCKITQGPEIGDHAFAMLLSLTRELHRIIPEE